MSVFVKKENGTVYLTEGTEIIGEFYGISSIGWLTLIRWDCDCFLLRDKLHEKVKSLYY